MQTKHFKESSNCIGTLLLHLKQQCCDGGVFVIW